LFQQPKIRFNIQYQDIDQISSFVMCKMQRNVLMRENRQLSSYKFYSVQSEDMLAIRDREKRLKKGHNFVK